MSEISEEELKTEIAKILKHADLATTSTKKVRLFLEKQYGVSLVDRKAIIDRLVMDYVNEMKSDDEEEEEEEVEDIKPKIKKEIIIKKEKKKSSKPKTSSKRKVESEDDSDDDIEESPKKRNRKAKEEGKKKPKRSGGGYTRVCQLSPSLSKLVGSDKMARHEVVKKIWSLIKENNLYDPNNKHFAVCDDSMYEVFGVKRFRAFGMMKYLKNHFID